MKNVMDDMAPLIKAQVKQTKFEEYKIKRISNK